LGTEEKKIGKTTASANVKFFKKYERWSALVRYLTTDKIGQFFDGTVVVIGVCSEVYWA